MIRGRVSFDVQGRFRSVVSGGWKLIWTPGQTPEREFQLYDVEADPDETRDLSREFPGRVEQLKAMLDGWMAGDSAVDSPEVPERDREALRELGYIEE
jgi:arylsulfatase A-like enzyme